MFPGRCPGLGWIAPSALLSDLREGNHLLAPSPEGRRPDSYQPGATRQVQERQHPRGPEARSIPAWRNPPGTGAAVRPRAEGPIHTSLAQRARYRSGNTPEGRRPDPYQPGATRQVQERQYARGPKARFIPAWRNPPGSGADTPRARGPIHTSLAQRARYRSGNTPEG